MRFVPNRVTPLSAQELYLFDTVGFVQIRGFLSRETAEECRRGVLNLPSRLMEGRADKERFDQIANLVPDFDQLAASNAIRLCVDPLINQPFRLVESYALRRKGNSVFYLHNGNSEIVRYGKDRTVMRNMGLSHTFHDGKLFCMLVKVLIYLTDIQKPEDGPFCYIQGSHKANFPCFPGLNRPALTRENFPSLDTVFVNSGDALLLNEALLHGTLPKITDSERLVIALTYAPSFVTDWKEVDTTSEDIHKLGHY
jgi:hypothetical protein